MAIPLIFKRIAIIFYIPTTKRRCLWSNKRGWLLFSHPLCVYGVGGFEPKHFFISLMRKRSLQSLGGLPGGGFAWDGDSHPWIFYFANAKAFTGCRPAGAAGCGVHSGEDDGECDGEVLGADGDDGICGDEIFRVNEVDARVWHCRGFNDWFKDLQGEALTRPVASLSSSSSLSRR